MTLECILHCTRLGGDPNNPIFRIGDRIQINESDILLKGVVPSSSYFSYEGVVFNFDAFRVVNIDEERDEKINQILDEKDISR